MKSNSNLLLAVIVVVGFIFFWDSFVVSKYKQAPKKVAATAGSTVNRTATTPFAGTGNTTQVLSNPNNPSKASIQTDSDVVSIDSLGGRISSWKVKERDHWIELVPTAKEPKYLPLQTFPDLNYGVESVKANTITLVAYHPSGFRIRKTITLNNLPAANTVILEFKNMSRTPVDVDSSIGWGPGLSKHVVFDDPKVEQAEVRNFETHAVAFKDKLLRWKPGVIFGRVVDETVPGPLDWVGVDNNHFLAAILPTTVQLSEVRVVADKQTMPTVMVPFRMTLRPGEENTFSYDLYVGPKHLSDLQALGHHLDQAINFGTFGVISKALLRALNFFKGLTGNFGWAIILLTVCLQIAVFPLTKKSLSHSVRMKELQPQLKQLQEQFKADPKRLQIETLNLYKKNGMHFMGLEGCFPILLQIPVFFAFYSALNNAYDLRGAPWIFWVKDLAAPDPYHVLPILMGIGMFFQQKLTTVATDPAQARMMMFMPVIFVFMFFKMPAGLVLYWSVNSICTIVGQRILRWQKESQKPLSP